MADMELAIAKGATGTEPAKPRRPLGALRVAVLHIADTFNEPLPAEDLAAFTTGDLGGEKV